MPTKVLIMELCAFLMVFPEKPSGPISLEGCYLCVHQWHPSWPPGFLAADIPHQFLLSCPKTLEKVASPQSLRLELIVPVVHLSVSLLLCTVWFSELLLFVFKVFNISDVIISCNLKT